MLLVAETAVIFLRFIQILCWIVFPLLLSVIMVTVLLHYRGKWKKTRKGSELEDKLLQGSPEQVGYTGKNGEFIFFDHSPLIREYKNRLSYKHARYTALQKDFASMRVKYMALADASQKHFSTIKNESMENNREEAPQPGVETNKLPGSVAEEMKELLVRLEESGKSYQSLEKENTLLQEQVKLMKASGDERSKIVERWSEETAQLRDKVAEQDYLKDILDEKNAEISFLQSQVEERIKNQHQSERQRLLAVAEIDGLKEQNIEQTVVIESIKNDILLKQEENDKMQSVLCGKEEQLNEMQQLLNAKLDEISYFGNVLRETKEQNEVLNAELGDKKDLVNSLQEQLTDGMTRMASLERKLAARRHLMQKLYREISTIINEDAEVSPVLALRQGHVSTEDKAIVVQQG